MASIAPAGWYADPMGRYEHRYWDGSQWTDTVARGGRQATDPINPSVTPRDHVQQAGPAADQKVTAATATTPASTTPASTTSAAAPQLAAITPLKVCPHCRVQATTTTTTCPSCGKRYIRKKKWPWVLGAVFLMMVVGFAGCLALVGTAAKRVVDELNAEQARHAITPSQFDAVRLGSLRVDVVRQLGKSPEDAQQFVQRGILSGQDINSSCVYYNKAGGSFGDRYQFCFENDTLRSKNAY